MDPACVVAPDVSPQDVTDAFDAFRAYARAFSDWLGGLELEQSRAVTFDILARLDRAIETTERWKVGEASASDTQAAWDATARLMARTLPGVPA